MLYPKLQVETPPVNPSAGLCTMDRRWRWYRHWYDCNSVTTVAYSSSTDTTGKLRVGPQSSQQAEAPGWLTLRARGLSTT